MFFREAAKVLIKRKKWTQIKIKALIGTRIKTSFDMGKPQKKGIF